MATAQTLADAILRKLGASNPTQAQRVNVLEAMNDLLTSWSAEGLLTHVNVRETHTLVASTGTYTWGSGGDISTARPVKLVDIFVRDSSGNDYPINIITEEFYNDISLKTTEGRPDRAYLATEYTLAKLFLYPVPSSAETLHLISWKPLSEVSSLTSTVSLPNEYRLAIKNNLLLELAGEYGYEPSPNDHKLASDSMNRLYDVNFKDIIVKFPREMTKFKTLNIDNLRFI